MNWALQHLHTASYLLRRAKTFDLTNIHSRIEAMLDIDNAEDSLRKAEELINSNIKGET